MVRYCLLLLFGCIFYLSHGQQAFNMTLLDHWDGVPNESSWEYSDVWGYTHTDGSEYAILGSIRHVHFFHIDSDTLIEVTRHQPGDPSLWRDFKSFGTYVYGVADQNSSTEGLLIYDMTTLPDSVAFVKHLKNDFLKAHNIFIDEVNDRLYVCGTRTNGQGLIVYDLSDPANPSLLARTRHDTFPFGPSAGNGYMHDLFVKDNIVYGSHRYAGLYAWDFTIPMSPTVVGGLVTGQYNHSSWITADGNHMVYAEEVPDGRLLGILDISNPLDFNIDLTFQDPLLAPTHTLVTPHNPYIIGNLLYVSYYEDGVQIWDISDLESPVRVAYYDTEPSNTSYGTHYGNWGVFPFFSGNKIIASDMKRGLYLLQLNYSVLPLEFINFKATSQVNSVQLEWQTTSETNVEYFDIEKSSDGDLFKKIGQITANNKINLNEYGYTDFLPATGVNYYRIKSVDTNGATQLTNVERVDFENTVSIKAFPNPTNGSFTLVIPDEYHSENISVQIRDLSGRLLYQDEKIAGIEAILNINTFLSEGVYLLEVTRDDTRIYQERLVVIQ